MSAEIRWGPVVLFCPGDRPDRVMKAASLADVVVIDLEDAVAPERREEARGHTATALEELDPDVTIVRVNAFGTADAKRDFRVLSGTNLHTCMLPKAESRAQVESLAGWRVIALCETPLGVIAAHEIAAATNCAGLMWGSEDLAAHLGGASSRSGGRLRPPMYQARLDVLMAAKAMNVAAIDTVYPDFRDLPGLHAEARDAAEDGFDAKACIHPSQGDTVRQAFLPDEEELARAVAILKAGQTSGPGAFELAGAMVDEPVLNWARKVVARDRIEAQRAVGEP